MHSRTKRKREKEKYKNKPYTILSSKFRREMRVATIRQGMCLLSEYEWNF